MDILIFLAQADVAAGGGGIEAKVLGPLGALALCLFILGIYARQTEKVRIPKLVALLEKEQAAHKETDKECDKKKDEIRKAYQAREKVLRRNLDRAKSRHGREKTRRIFFQTEAGNLAKRLKEEPPKLPTEIGATSFGHRPLPRDPEPVVDEEDDELPPPPEV